MRFIKLLCLYVILCYSPTSTFDLKKKLFSRFRKKKDDELKKCRVSHSGVEYEGDIAETKSGLLCQQWEPTVDPVHKVSEDIKDSDFPEGSKKKARNYCRNPRWLKSTPWCYTMDNSVALEECVVPLCVKKECRLTGPGVEYGGLTHYSGSRECLPWIDVSGVEYKDVMFDSLFPDKTRKQAENRCRNPDSDPGGPWCFVDTGVRSSGVSPYEKSHCGIPFCDPKPCMTTTTLVSSGYRNYHTVFSILPPNTTKIEFSVKLWKPEEWRSAELVIALMVLPLPQTGEEMIMWKNGIEITISNYKSGITPREGEEPDWNIEPELLRGTKWQDLELAWMGGIVSLKIKGKAMSVFTKDYTDSKNNIFNGEFQYFSIKGSHALWNFPYCSSESCDEKIITTHGDFNRRWPLSKTSTGYEIKFFIRGFHTAIVELKIGAMLQYPSVQLTLMNKKRQNHTTLTIAESYGKERKILKEVKIDSLISNWEWREFQLVIDKSHLKLSWVKNVRSDEILVVEHPKFELLKWFSIGSRQSTVYWTINCSPSPKDHKIPAEVPECVMTEGEKDFKGYQSITATGLTCLPWLDPTGKKFLPKFSDNKFVDGSVEDAKNYCRNPFGLDKGPFCYAVDLADSGFQIKKEFCFPRICRSKECKMAGTGNDYIGLVSTTVSQRGCQRWSAKYPHEIPQSLLYVEMFPELSLNDANDLCRNPSHDPAGPWCYTVDPAVDTDLCYVPDCDQPVACTIIVKGNITRQSIYILPLWRTLGFGFKVKSWDPKKTEGLRFIIRSADEDNQFRLDMGGENNDKIILYHNTTDGKEIVVKQKTVGHIIPSGQWAGFILVLGFGEVTLGFEHVPSPFFEWKYIYSGDKIEPFMPRYLSYYALGNEYSVGLSTACEECHTHITEPGLIENVYPLHWWKTSTDQRNKKSLTLFIRGTGTFILVLHRLVNDISNRVLIEVSDYGMIVVKDRDSIIGETSREDPIFKNHTWTNFTLEFTENKLLIRLKNVIISEFNSGKVLLFYYFSVSVSTGLLKWSANCEPPNIDAAPVNGGWSEWGPWECSVTCGGGHGRRRRKCDLPKPNLFGQPCEGSDVMEGVCNDFRCGHVPPSLYNTIAKLMTKQAYNIQKRVGENLTVSCNQFVLTELKDVAPRTKVEWTRNGVLIDEQKRVGNISVDQFQVVKYNVNLTDSGIYICGLEDHKGVKTAIQLTAVTVTTNSTTRWSVDQSRLLLGCEFAPLTFLFSDLTQFWTLNGRLFQDPLVQYYSLGDIDWLYPVSFKHRGEWECVVHQIKHNLTWITTWFRLGVRENTLWSIMFDKIFTGERSFRPFGDRKILNSLTGIALVGAVVICITSIIFFIVMMRNNKKKKETSLRKELAELEGNAIVMDQFKPKQQVKKKPKKGIAKIKNIVNKLKIYKSAIRKLKEGRKKKESFDKQQMTQMNERRMSISTDEEEPLIRAPSTSSITSVKKLTQDFEEKQRLIRTSSASSITSMKHPLKRTPSTSSITSMKHPLKRTPSTSSITSMKHPLRRTPSTSSITSLKHRGFEEEQSLIKSERGKVGKLQDLIAKFEHRKK